ncbi:UDP-N-acetyl-D-glucosamine dehydrogenase [Gandjariella thermophila]|uniref:UDP-N-acetyl-D-glucosamine dehydrogenase n=1 Tax=Gandjariella thermophila TaxID=1931992 RepID=A0A4D4J9T5_9PSEU|nr:UDP-N-acetyl-D-glucosamine dehydrogenase [Gandjariella thermophila]
MVGQGYVGLPLAMRAVEIGLDVLGFDLDKDRVDRLRRATSFVEDVTDTDLASALATGRYLPTDDPAALSGFDTAVVCVPTPLRDGIPELCYIEDAARILAPHVSPGCCVVLESTTYPGTTEEIFVPILEAGSGLRAGADFHVGYSPERIDPGNPTWHFHNTPKVVSGIDEASLKAVDAFYGQLVMRTVPVPGPREAELAKLLENTFRHVNIALVNELAVYAHGLGIDVWSVIDAAATKPFGFMKFTPGPGVGGHCLPIDPSYLSWQVRRSLGHAFRFVDIANDVNDHMPDYVVSRVVQHLNHRRKPVNGSSVLLIGLTYKRNSADARHSPAMSVAKRLADLGAELRAADPLIDAVEVPSHITLVPCTADEVSRSDLVVVLTDHDDIDWGLLARHADRVFDTRNRLRGTAADTL